MFEALLHQATGESLTAIIIGAIATLIPTVSIILKQWSEGKFTKERLAEKSLEVQDAFATEENQRRAIDRLSCVVAQLIVANNDGKVTQPEYDQIIATARNALIETGRDAGMDTSEIVRTAELLLQKKV